MKALLILIATPVLFAQDFQTKLGTEAIDFLGGVVYTHGNGHTNPAYGAKLRLGLSRFFSAYGDFGYSRLVSDNISSSLATIERRGSVMDYGGGGEVHLSGYRLQPYGLLGAGAMRIGAKVFSGGQELQHSTYYFAGSAGGGLRVFATKEFGLSLEAKSVAFGRNIRYERYSVGIFYQRPKPRE